MTLDIHSLMQALSQSRPIFHSEADFQHALAWQIGKRLGDHSVRLEYPFTADGSDNRELDIWLPKEKIAIELKYFTMKFELDSEVEPFALKQHAAADLARKGFLQDVERLEGIVNTGEHSATAGLAILLTNAPTLWDESYTSKRRIPNDAKYHLYEGKTIKGTLPWLHNGQLNEDVVPVRLSGSYTTCWKDYSCFPSQKNGGIFRYLAFKIQPTT